MKIFLTGFFSGAIIIFVIINFYSSIFDEKNKNNLDIKIGTEAHVKNYEQDKDCSNLVIYSEKNTISAATADKQSTNPDNNTKDIVDELMSFQNFINRIPDSNISTYARNTFEKEPVDPAWASDHQLSLDHFFRTDTELQSIIPQSIECKTSICKISITASEDNERNKISSHILNSLRNNKSNIPVKVLFDTSDIGIDIYLPRSNDGFVSTTN